MNDDELREAILGELEANRTSGADRTPLRMSDANLVTRVDCDADQLNRVLQQLMAEGLVHGRQRRVQSTDLQMECDFIRLADDPLPEPDPRDLD